MNKLYTSTHLLSKTSFSKMKNWKFRFIKYNIYFIFIILFSNNLTSLGQATTIFSQNFETASWNLPTGLSPAWSGTTTPANNVWHLNSYTTGWSSTSGAYSPTGANGTTQSARFHSYDATSATTGDLITPIIDLSAYPNQPKTLMFYMINTSGADKVDVFLSTDGTTYGSSLGTYTTYSSWTLITIPLGTTSSSTVKVKFTAISDFGATDIGIDEVKIVNATVFTSSGSWTAPAGVCTATVECWGGGGAGGGTGTAGVVKTGGGGGGGAYARNPSVTVTPGSAYTIVVGAGGTGVSAAAGNTGGSSTFNTTTVVAVGGGGGGATNTSTGGAAGTGGASGSCTGTTVYSGGNGAAGTGTITGSGGGGSSAGSATAGNNASGVTGGAAPTDGGRGANGVNANGIGAVGFSIGAGGSGSYGSATSTTARAGGNGASGLVYISYTPSPVLSAPVITTTTLCPGTGLTVSGTSSETTGTTITVYKNGTSLTTTTVSSGTWSVTGLTLTGGDVITAKASSSSCNASSASNAVTVPVLGTATATATPSTICAGSSSSLSVVYTKSGSSVIGSGSTSSSSSPTPFSGVYGGMKGQYIILASEMTAAGFNAGNITSIGINFSSAVTATYSGLTIQMGNTSLSAFPATLSLESSGLTTYYGPTNLVNPVAGVNTFTFSTPYYWDGVSNIIISTNWSNNTTTSTAASVVTTTTAFNSAQVHKRDSYTPAALLALTGTQSGGSSTVGTTRPNFTLTGNTVPAPTAYSWSDGTSTVGSTNPLSVSPTTNTTYTCTATVSGCSVVSNSVPVTVTTVSAPTADVSSSTQCGSAIPTVSVSGTAANMRWYSASSGGTLLQTGGLTYSTAISTTTTFYVAQVSGSCESQTRTPLTVTVTSPDALTASASALSICQGNSVDLSVSQTGSTNSYSLLWTASPSANSGIPTSVAGSLSTPTTITPNGTGTYVYTITGTDGSCVATSTVSVTVNAAPSITVNPANPATACNTANTTLTATTANATSWQWQSSSTSGGTYTNVANGTPSGATYTGGTTTSLAISGLTTTYYYKLIASSAGCIDAVSTAATVTVNNPSITGTTPASRCGAGTVTVGATGSAGTTLNWYAGLTGGSSLGTGTSFVTPSISTTTTYYVSAEIPTVSSGNATIGTATTLTTASGIEPTAFNNRYENFWEQMIYTGSELQASGLSAGNITALSFNISTLGDAATNANYSINLKTTSSSTLTGFDAGSSTRVYGPSTYTHTSSGWQVITFTTPFYWDGTSNILVDIRSTGADLTNNSQTYYTATTGNTVASATTSTTYTNPDAYVATNPAASLSAKRLNIIFTGQVTSSCASSPRTAVVATINTAPTITPTGTATICNGASTVIDVSSTNDPNYTYSWMPGSLSGASQNVSPTSTATYTVTATDASGGTYNGCSTSGTVIITVNNVPAAVSATGIIPANSATNVCYAGSGAITSLTWTAVSGATSYDVYFGAGALPGTVTANVTTNSWTISPALAASTTYYWKVVAKNACGDAVGSSTWSFTTNSGPCYCTSNPSSNDGSGITGVTVGSATFSVADVTYYNYTGSIPDLTQGTTITSSITFATGFTYDSHIWIDFNDDGVFDNTTEKVYTGVSTSTNPTTLNTTFPLSASAALGQHKMRIGTADAGQATPNSCYSGTFGVTIDLDVNVVAPTACSGTPTGGTVTVTPSSGATGSTYGVSASGFSTSTGITYQWQYSDDGTTWTNQGASSSTYASLTGLTAPAFGVVRSWRLVVTCTNSGISTNSTVGTFTSTYCTSTSSANTGYINSFSTSGGLSDITNNSTGYTTGGYTNYTAQSASQYLGSTVNISVTLGSGTGLGTGIAIYIDWNQDGDFIDAGELVYNPGYSYSTVNTGNFTVPATALLGNTRMRVVTNYNASTPASCNSGITGETEDYTFTVVALPACSGTPTAGTASITSGSTICVSGTATITASGFTTGASGLSYNWQSAPDVSGTPGTFADISGATTPATYTSGTLTSDTWFRLRVTCSNSTSTTYTTTPVLSTVTNPTITNTTPDTICGSGTLTLDATGSAGTSLSWYATASGGSSIGTGTSFITPSISNTTTYYVSADVISTGNAIVGSGATTIANDYSNPFYSNWSHTQQQIMIKAAELNAAGLRAGNITGLSLSITAGTTIMPDFSLAIASYANTNNSLTALLTSGFTTVYTNATGITPVANASPNNNTITFTTPFNWDGTSHIVLKFCWGNSASTATMNSTSVADATGYVCSVNAHNTSATSGSSICGSTSVYSTYSNRPRFTFYGQTACSSSPRTPVIATVVATVLKPTARPDTSVCVNSTVKLYVGGSSISSSATLLNENFNSTAISTLPSGWTTSLPYSDVTMEVTASTNAGGTTNELDIGGGFNTSASGNFTLTLPAFNASTVLSGLQLSLKHMIDHYSSSYSYTLKIQSSTNGSTWTDRWSSGVVTADVAATTLNIDLSALSGQSTVYIRFLLTGSAFGLSDWYIDDMVVSGNISVPAYYTWSPTTDLYVDAAASIAYNPTVHTNKDTLYAKPSDTITYIVSASSVVGLPALCPSNDTVVINVSQIPAASIDAARLFACDASAKLSLSSLNPSSSTVNWTRTAGTGSASASGNPATVTGLSAGTNTYDITATNGACVNKPIGSVSVSMPTVSTTDITSTTSCDYCVYNDGNMKSLYNAGDGKLIATIEDDATVTPDKLDETQICVRFDPSVQTVVDDLGYNQPYLQRQWTIHPANGTRAKVTLYFTDAELLALQAAANTGNYQFSGYTSLSVTKYSGGQDGTFIAPASSGGTFVPATFSAYNGDHKVEFTVDNFSTFYIHPILFAFSVLPVELSSFNVACNNGEGILHWTTRSEVNAKEFVLERSSGNANIFVPIAVIPAAGNSNVTIEYSYTVDDVPVYYRLKEVDNSGNYKYSSTITLSCETAVTAFHAYPSLQSLMVEAHVAVAGDYSFTLVDIQGKEISQSIQTLQSGSSLFSITDITNLPKGIYMLRIQSKANNYSVTRKIAIN